jgi:HD-GYP domain-containing protein (c-di-GMP phosphodiesterase class II)
MNVQLRITPAKTPSITAGIIALLLMAGLGAYLINVYISKERERDLQHWESRLNLVADTRMDAIERWIDLRHDELQELADNASLRLYLWQTLQQDRRTSGSEPAQLSYLRNLILAAADQAGYFSRDTPRIPADLPQKQTTGLALLNVTLQPIITTPGMPEIGEAGRKAAEAALTTGRQQISDLILDGQDRAVIAFAVPVTAVPGAQTDEPAPIGVLLGIRNADSELMPLLHQGASFAEDSEALLLAQRDNRVVYLSPGRDGVKPTRRSMQMDRTLVGGVNAARAPGSFGEYTNYHGESVLQVSRRLESSPWILVQQVDAGQAMKASNEHRRFLVTALSLLLLSVVAMSIAAWRHGSSVRAQRQARELHNMALRLQKETELLHAITDNIDTPTLLLSQDGRILYSNKTADNTVAAALPDLIGKPLGAVLGPAVAAALEKSIQVARTGGKSVWQVISLTIGGKRCSYRAGFIPVERIGHHEQPLLLVLADITQLQKVQQRHSSLLRNLVSTLVHVVDRHDPWSAHHSKRLVEVVNAIGRELRLGKKERQTLELAATLANLGKSMIPREILVKTEPLTDAEHDLLLQHVQHGLELLEGLDLEGPVLETIAQKQELLDGSGYPNGLRAEQMGQTGKILSVANAFVALTSNRAYRPGISTQEAVSELMAGVDTCYDRQVVAALFHIAENRKEWLGHDS